MNSEKESGFTLLEVMITMVIISLGLIGTAKLLITVIQQNKDSELRTDASAVVHTLLNEASARINSVDDCTALTANASGRSYLHKKYIETVTCEELGSGKEHYRISASIAVRYGKNNATASLGGTVSTVKVLAESSTIITTASATK